MRKTILIAIAVAVLATAGWQWTEPTEFGVVFTYGFHAVDDHGSVRILSGPRPTPDATHYRYDGTIDYNAYPSEGWIENLLLTEHHDHAIAHQRGPPLDPIEVREAFAQHIASSRNSIVADHAAFVQSHTGLHLSRLVRRDQPFERVVWAAWLSLALRTLSYLAWGGVLIMLVIAIRRRLRCRRRVRAGACHICGYDLTNVPEPCFACPECGQLIWHDDHDPPLTQTTPSAPPAIHPHPSRSTPAP